MEYHLLESGSKGNCLVIRSGDCLVVVDCGGSKKYLLGCFSQLGIDYETADGLLLTHEHSDHIKQLAMFAKLPVYAPFEVHSIGDELLVTPYQSFKIKNLTITPVPLSHDAPVTVGYIFDDGNSRLVEITDTGYVSSQNMALIQNADYYVFESNYDSEMLMLSARPAYLKARIRSDSGHMCNDDTAACLAHCIGKQTKEITLAHISQETNSRDTALYCLKNELLAQKIPFQNINIRAAGQFEICSGGVQ